jgi:hypothetical protein
VLPGERLTAANLATLQRTLAHGGVGRGAADPTLRTVLVVAEPAALEAARRPPSPRARGGLMLALALALGASVAWGGSDFVAGLASRRMPLLAVLVGSQVAGLVLLLGLLAVTGEAPPPGGAVLAAALAASPSSSASRPSTRAWRWADVRRAPISSTAALVPVTASVLTGARPSDRGGVGMGLVLLGAALACAEPDAGAPGALGTVVPGAGAGRARGTVLRRLLRRDGLGRHEAGRRVGGGPEPVDVGLRARLRGRADAPARRAAGGPTSPPSPPSACSTPRPTRCSPSR